MDESVQVQWGVIVCHHARSSVGQTETLALSRRLCKRDLSNFAWGSPSLSFYTLLPVSFYCARTSHNDFLQKKRHVERLVEDLCWIVPRVSPTSPKGVRGYLMPLLCLESQGCHLIALYYLLACSSACSRCSFCHVFFSVFFFLFFLPTGSFSWFFLSFSLPGKFFSIFR